MCNLEGFQITYRSFLFLAVRNPEVATIHGRMTSDLGVQPPNDDDGSPQPPMTSAIEICLSIYTHPDRYPSHEIKACGI